MQTDRTSSLRATSFCTLHGQIASKYAPEKVAHNYYLLSVFGVVSLLVYVMSAEAVD